MESALGIPRTDRLTLKSGDNRIHESFDNPDHDAIVIHNYRWRLGLADSDPTLDDIETFLAEGPLINVPTITLEATRMVRLAQSRTRTRRSSRALTSNRTIAGGVGHALPQEAPDAFVEAVVDVDARAKARR